MITRLIAGNRVITLGTAIEQHFLVTQDWGMGSTIAVFLIIAMVLIMMLTGNRKEGTINEKKIKLGSNVYLFIVFFILYAPIFYLMFYSFNSGGTMINFEGFTWIGIKKLFGDTRFLIIVLNTIIIALLSAVNFNHYWCIWSTWQFTM